MEKKLKKLGFKKCYTDDVDKNCFHWRKNIKHPFLKGLHIIVDQCITVYCKETSNTIGKLKNGWGDEFAIIFQSKTEKNLDRIIRLLNVSEKA